MSEDVAFHGVTLQEYTGVVVAREAGIDLAEVLAQEQIEEGAWPTAERAWREALTDDPGLMMRYLKLRAQAEDSLARRLEPLDDDPGAWSGLLSAWVIAADPVKLLDALGLEVIDVNRLGRKWMARAEADEKVAAQLRDLAGKTPAPTKVQAEPMVLKPFPWTKGGKAAAATSPVDAPAEAFQALRAPRAGRLPVEVDPDLFAALSQIVERLPKKADRALALCGLDRARLAPITDAWTARARSDPQVRAELEMRMADHRMVLAAILGGARPVRASR